MYVPLIKESCLITFLQLGAFKVKEIWRGPGCPEVNDNNTWRVTSFKSYSIR